MPMRPPCPAFALVLLPLALLGCAAAKPDNLLSAVMQQECSMLNLDRGLPYCRLVPAAPEPPPFCTRSRGAVDCWRQPPVASPPYRGLADTPAGPPAERQTRPWPRLTEETAPGATGATVGSTLPATMTAVPVEIGQPVVQGMAQPVPPVAQAAPQAVAQPMPPVVQAAPQAVAQSRAPVVQPAPQAVAHPAPPEAQAVPQAVAQPVPPLVQAAPQAVAQPAGSTPARVVPASQSVP